MHWEERRAHARIQVAKEIVVRTAASEVAARLQDISRGGAALLVSAPLGQVGTRLELVLPGDGGALCVTAEVMRSMAVAEGQMIAVRFVGLDSELDQSLLRLLDEWLYGDGGGSRRHPRVAARVRVRVDSPSGLLATLRDVSVGGLSLTLPESFTIGEEVVIILPDSTDDDLLSLRACVIHRSELPESDPPQYLTGLSFQLMSPERRALLDSLIRFLTRGR